LAKRFDKLSDTIDLTGKAAIITGGNRGIGRGIADCFAEAGANIAILSRSKDSAETAIREMLEKYPGGDHIFVHCEVGKTEDCKAAVAAVKAHYGKIDILVNNSGVKTVGAIIDMDESMADWDECINVDLTGTMRMSYFAAKVMMEAGEGKIINISSNAGDMVNKPLFLSAYSAAKAGVNMLTENMACELSKYGVYVNAIAPGYAEMEGAENMPPEMYEMFTGKMQIKRLIPRREIGALAVFLASSASDSITGEVFKIDGGYSLAI